jgi:ribosome recycling factor
MIVRPEMRSQQASSAWRNRYTIERSGGYIMLTQFEEKMGKTMASLEREYQGIRAGRANPHILDKIKVDYYGTPTPLQQVGNINVPEARMLVIQPWDSSLIKAIEKAILNSDIGINPSNDGKVIRLVFPELTEERRKELVKDVKKKGEQAKVAIRNIRRDANDYLKKQNKANEISEDDLKDNEEKVQKMTDKYIKEVDKAIEAKSKEILTI